VAFDLLIISGMKAQAYRSSWIRLVLPATLAVGVLMNVDCHPKPVIVTTSSVTVGGTIAGVLNGPSESTLGNRTITVINLETGQRYQTTTGMNGGYSMQVPPGNYRLDIELRNGEQLASGDATILLKNGDATVDSHVDANANRE
jgi:carboxypeptidase family protein